MKQVLAAGIKYATNHIINHIPSYTLRHAWYRHILGWRIGPNVVIFMGQHVQKHNHQLGLPALHDGRPGNRGKRQHLGGCVVSKRYA